MDDVIMQKKQGLMFISYVSCPFSGLTMAWDTHENGTAWNAAESTMQKHLMNI